MWAHFRAQPLPTWGTLGKTNSSFCPCSCTVNPFSLIVWIWFCFIMAKVLRLPANAICLQSGDVRDLPKWLCSRLRSLQEQMGGRSMLQAGTRLCSCWGTWLSPPEFPHSTWVRASASTRWDKFRLLITPSAWCTQNQETKLCWRPNHAKHDQGFFCFPFSLFFFNLKGILRLTKNQRLSD